MPVPWTVMMKYLKTGAIFFLTEIAASSEEDAISVVKEQGYCLTSGAWIVTAKQVPLLPVLTKVESDVPSHEPISSQEAGVSVKVRTTRQK